MSDETRKKMSESAKRRFSLTTHPKTGSKLTQEHKDI
ncbi:MAG: hypothetical protein GEU26_13445 [Nitrososphaeraceae archaeon]|nr:hypothetical protein [Nitrososphaeraceae archaeon]